MHTHLQVASICIKESGWNSGFFIQFRKMWPWNRFLGLLFTKFLKIFSCIVIIWTIFWEKDISVCLLKKSEAGLKTWFWLVNPACSTSIHRHCFTPCACFASPCRRLPKDRVQWQLFRAGGWGKLPAPETKVTCPPKNCLFPKFLPSKHKYRLYLACLILFASFTTVSCACAIKAHKKDVLEMEMKMLLTTSSRNNKLIFKHLSAL